jgi:uncharacterized membrane protein
MLSEHHPRFQRWYGPKAHAVISCIEIVFWSVVFGLMFSTNVNYCKGVTCGLGWIVVIIAVIMVYVENLLHLATMDANKLQCIRNHSRRHHHQRISRMEASREAQDDEHQAAPLAHFRGR